MKQRRLCAFLSVVVFLLYACSSAPPPRYEITYTDPAFSYREAFHDGFALAPVDQAKPIIGSAGSLASLTNDLYTAFLTFTENAEIVEPGVVLERAKKAGEDQAVQLRKFQRDRINGVDLIQGDCARIFAWLSERFLFVSWVEESGEVGLQEGQTIDYTDIDFSQDIYAVAYQKFQGQLTGELIDLVKGERVWSAVVRYATGEMYKDNLPADLWTQRSRACVAMARLLSVD